MPRPRTLDLGLQFEGGEGVHQTQVVVLLEQEFSSSLWPAILVQVSSELPLAVALLTQLAPGQVASMAQRWCAIPEPYTSIDIVGGHDAGETREKYDRCLCPVVSAVEMEGAIRSHANSHPVRRRFAHRRAARGGRARLLSVSPRGSPTPLYLAALSSDRVPTRSGGRGLAR